MPRRYPGLSPSRVCIRIPLTRRLGQRVSLHKILRFRVRQLLSQFRCLSILLAMSSRVYLLFPSRADYGSTGYGCQSCSWSAEQGKMLFLSVERARIRTNTGRPSRVNGHYSVLYITHVALHNYSTVSGTCFHKQYCLVDAF